MSEIKGNEYPLFKIFSSDFEYHIPAYQRPYAWTEEEIGTLFDDLYSFYQTENESENYFLGSIVLIKDNMNRAADVIDGQQRLTSLTILFSALSYNIGDTEAKSSCMELLKSKGNKIAGIESQPRLFLRDWDQAFFNKYIQNVSIKELISLDIETLDTESKKHIKLNCETLLEKIDEAFRGDSDNADNKIIRFCKFLLNRCYLVVVSTPSQDSAFRVFSVMNSRGLDLLPTDIIKSETIGKLPKDLQASYTDKWENLENEVGRDGFNEVFAHTRTIFAMDKAKKNLLDEIHEFVIPETTPQDLVDNYLEPYTNAYMKLKNCEYVATENAKEINEYLYWLNKNGNYDWMPSAILFFTQHMNDSKYSLWFVNKLERLAAYLQVTGQDVSRRIARYKHILVEMKENPNSDMNNPLRNIELTEWEKQQFIDVLDGDIYTMPSVRRNYIIQRLDSFVSDGGAKYNTNIFTIEHVLPQTPSIESGWLDLWPDASERMKWLNKIANLVPLTRQRNSAAQNYDFNTKKIKYFQTRGGTTSYQLTTQVISVSEWTPKVVSTRQRNLLDVFKDKWDLNCLEDSKENAVFLLAGRGGAAKGKPLGNDKFIVLEGSRISDDITKSFVSGYANLRSSLIEQGIVVNNVFVDDYIFDSSSAAAAVILGRTANGRKEWSTLDGRALGKYSQ